MLNHTHSSGCIGVLACPTMPPPVICGVLITSFFGVILVPLLMVLVRTVVLKKKEQVRSVLKELWPVEDCPYKKGGFFVGIFERVILFAGFWLPGGLPFITGWLVLKTAIYWQGSTYASMPYKSPKADQVDYFLELRQLGSYHATAALVGTSANIVLALIGVWIGHRL